MPGVPSNKACERCKKRHLKCDETRPSCQRCIGAGVECPGYIQTRKFIDQGATVRRRYAPYQEMHPKPSTVSDSSKATAGAQNKNQHGSRPLEQQCQALSSETRDDSALHLQMEGANLGSRNEPMITETPEPANGPGMTAEHRHTNLLKDTSGRGHLSAVGEDSGTTSTAIHSSVSPNASVGAFGGAENASNAMQFNRPDNRRLVSSEASSQSEKADFQDIFTELLTGTEHETAFLIRHFSEAIGPWLDLSDSGKFFAVYVPIRALNNLSLKCAIAALAAKHLGRVKGAKSPTGGGMFTRPATMEIYPNAAQVDWFLKAANYYYLAASELSSLASDGYTPVSSSAVLASPIETVGRWLSSQAAKDGLNFAGEEPSDVSMLRKTEDLLAVTVLLTFYRLMDTNGDEWPQHLLGIRALFDSLLAGYTGSVCSFSHGIRAAFWNFARQDHLGSYLARLPTHLDSQNYPLWRAAGISIDDQEKFHIATRWAMHSPQEDQAANGLVWLVSKVVNFLASTKQSQLAQWTGSSPAASPGPVVNSQQSYPDTNTWLSLCFDFQTWFEGAPETIRPCARLEHPKDLSNLPEGANLPFPEIFFSLTTCAAAMQHYHFGRIALLLNRPADLVSAPSTAFDRLQGYREVTKEVEYRSREVCGIALGRPSGGVRIYMVPLLFAVAQCLESAEERQVIVDLLCGVEADLGWATEYAVQKLQASWNRVVY